MKPTLILRSLAVAGALFASRADGAILVNLTNPGSNTVNVGDTISARIFASTDNANGIAVLNVRVTTSTASIGGTASASPFLASVLPVTGTTGSSGVVTTFNPALDTGGLTTVLGRGTATFVADGADLVPNSTTGNRPLTVFTGQGSEGRGTPRFFSAGNASLTYLGDVSFKALREGTIYFGLSPNTPTGSEYTSSSLGNTTTTTATVSLANGAGGTGFSVTVVPEPTSAAILGIGGAALLGWRRRRSRAAF